MSGDPAEIGRTALFGGLGAEELEEVARRLRRDRFATGAEIVREGEPGRRMYLIESGSAEVVKAGGPREPAQRIGTLGPGDCFGEMALVDIQPRSATVRALEATTTLSMSGPDLFSIRHWRPETFAAIALNLAREISRRLRRTDALAAEFLTTRR